MTTRRLQPYMSKETLEYHHDKHHKAYVDNGNKLAAEAGMDELSLEEIVKQSFGKNAGLFNNAAPALQPHSFLEMDEEGAAAATSFLASCRRQSRAISAATTSSRPISSLPAPRNSARAGPGFP